MAQPEVVDPYLVDHSLFFTQNL